MSVEKMAEVWMCDISAPWQQILLAMADRADNDGKSLFPSAEYLAWRLGKSERQVRALWAALRKAEALKVLVPATQHHPTHYQLNLSILPKKTPWETLRELKKQSRDEVSAGLRHEEIAPLESQTCNPAFPDLQSSVSRPEAGCTLFIRDSSIEGEGEEKPLPPQKNFFKEAGWEKEDRWLYDFLVEQRFLTVPQEYLLSNPLWWISVGIPCHGLSIDFLRDEFAKMSAHLEENPEKRLKSRKGWLRFIRNWLIRETRWREEERARAEKRAARK